MRRIQVVDSHTGGEPTRVVLEGGPELGTGPLAERRRRLDDEFDAFRRAVILEPRGSDILVGALLCPPVDTTSVAGVIFFNNVGSLGMCGHGAIGVAATLAHVGRIEAGSHRLETPVGDVPFEYHGGGRATIENVPSYRLARDVQLSVPGYGVVSGSVAWGGNWFFLVDRHQERVEPDNIPRLLEVATRIRRALDASGVRGADGAMIDHVELFGPPSTSRADSRNFVLCPGGAYDRSPCGTGTSAKLACLWADGKLAPDRAWRQESIVGSLFEGRLRVHDGRVHPCITGEAFVTAESTLLLDDADPFRDGLPLPTPLTRPSGRAGA